MLSVKLTHFLNNLFCKRPYMFHFRNIIKFYKTQYIEMSQTNKKTKLFYYALNNKKLSLVIKNIKFHCF